MYLKSTVILMAEDNEHDKIAVRRVWNKKNILNPLFIVNDGEECLDYLYKRNKYYGDKEAPIPGLIILDINMPKLDGISVLKKLRGDNKFKHLPIFIFTTSKADEDRIKSYRAGANAFIIKPFGFQKFADTLQTITQFWQIVEWPNNESLN